MPTALNADENRDASLRAQYPAAFQEFPLVEPPTEPVPWNSLDAARRRIHLFEKVRASGLATLDEDASNVVRAAVEFAVDATMYVTNDADRWRFRRLAGPDTRTRAWLGLSSERITQWWPKPTSATAMECAWVSTCGVTATSVKSPSSMCDSIV